MKSNYDLLFSENENFKIVCVKLDQSDRLYTYKTMLDIAVDDYILVPVREQYMVVKAVRVVTYAEFFTEMPHNFYVRWVVQKVDFSQYTQMNKVEMDLNKAEQNLRLKQLKDAYYQDPANKELQTEFKKLLNS